MVAIVIPDAIIIALIGLAGALLTGAAAKIFDYRFNKMKHEFDKNMQTHAVASEEIKTLKEELENRRVEIRQLEEELDKWKSKYYEMLEHLITLRSKIIE